MKKLLVLAGVLAASTACAAELKVLPAEVALTGAHTKQSLIVVDSENGVVIADRTAQAKFVSSNPGVVVVDDKGRLKAVGDGDALITAAVGGKQASAKVAVRKTTEPATQSFRNEVIPLMTKAGCNSGACHGALAGKGGMKLSLRGYDPDADFFVLTRQALSRRVDRQEPNHSLLLRKATLATQHGGGQKLAVGGDDYQLLAEWIAAGAPGPKAGDAVVQRIEVFPAAALLKPKDGLQMLVRAWYSDGHSADVTHWAKFSSSEELVAKVDAEGKVQVDGYGETAVTVWYSNNVAASSILSPLAQTVPPKVFADAARTNFIDELVLKKLETLHLPPSPQCSDEEFIRRAFLDAAGILPAPEEVQKFLADTSANKRARLIDALVERPEFVDYWAYKWSDMFLVSSRRLPQPAVWAFYQFIRQSVADNKPWDRFAREVLTARGNNLQNGAANYFLLHKDVTDLTEATSVTFLGMSITCARCHNHPLEKWTQDQYWGMANLFSRVVLKNGDRAGEVTVQAQPSGDVPHPRRGTPVDPAPLDGTALALDDPADRRIALANWMTAADNPYFAHALVNRVWRNFLGRGLVEAEDDLRQTNPPTNAALFDALAKDFVSHRYDVKHLIRTVMTSATYQRSSKALSENVTDDRFYSHYLVRRLPAEVILDIYSQVSGVPTRFTHLYSGVERNLAETTAFPLGTRAMQLPDGAVASRFLDSFGRPDRTAACSCERQQDATVGQALHVNNGQTLNDKLRDRNSRVTQWFNEKIGDEDAIRRIYLLALSRTPNTAEVTQFKALLAEAGKDPTITRREVFEDLFWAVLSGREFLFNH